MADSALKGTPEPRASGVQSVERALDILELLSRSEGELGVSELGAATGLALGTVHRLLGTLISRGYARQNPTTRKYGLGLRALGMADAAREHIGPLAQPFLQELMQVSQETANLAILEQNSTMYIHQIPATRMVRMFTKPGNRAPVHATGTGKVLLAYQPAEVVQAIIRQNGLPSITPNTITDLPSLLQELDLIRERGYAVDFEEQEEGVRCLAAPIFSPNGEILAAISLSGPATRLHEAHLEELIPHIKRIAAAFSRTLNPSS